MDYYGLIEMIAPQADFNPACFDFSEDEAREKLLWRDPRPMPTPAQLADAQVLLDAANAKAKLKNLFAGIRRLWQQLSDDFAAENALLGITQEGKTKEIADKFDRVIYYLNVNSPNEAIAELDLVVRDNKYCTDARLNALKAKLIEYINANA